MTVPDNYLGVPRVCRLAGTRIPDDYQLEPRRDINETVRIRGPVPRPKAERECCAAKRDRYGRYPVGFCGPDCVGRADWVAFLGAKP